MCETELMQKAINVALENVTSLHGGPFGAIVVQNGKIIAVGRNEVTATNDPTAHAEIQAIRAACQYLNSFQLDDCEIYTSCEPCPMCIGAIYWARPKAVYYASTKEDAAKIGFDDQFIYEELALPIEKRRILMKQIQLDQYNLPFALWEESTAKTHY
ncbi:nucleoside deaminase [Robertmurraya yapensis]|uniref:Nucleoside deaminase n=2 Tax=Bacillaceae TaxID=186817 RepID=A0A431WJT9_9BACI|nr:nucleoside deaminase [Bacillus yapensis]RTR35746.1 nucleoside deaminase [Bacillus yapensis]TKS98548.1 nucleoside deaminase [Bacillus yapensis]